MKYRCDIVLLSYESPDLLKACIKSILDYTRINVRLIIVDNASRDPEVFRYLQGVKGNDNVTVEKIFSEENAGFAGGINKGFRFSQAEYVCILNNDCVVTEDWLEEMIAIAEKEERIGLVNPQSNTFGSVPDKGATINDHAELLKVKRGDYVELGHAIGFACLIKREVLDKIGYLDEAYKGVCYEDTDFSVRAQKAGYVSVMAEGSYVFHLEQASRKGLKGKEEIYRRNRKIFEDKWGRLLRVLYFDRQNNGEEDIKKIYELFRKLAHERVTIDMRIKGCKDVLPPSVRKHADISVHITGKGPSVLSLVWSILTKKKRYDAVMAHNVWLLKIIRGVSLLRGVRVFILDKESGEVVSPEGKSFNLNMPSDLAKYIRTRG